MNALLPFARSRHWLRSLLAAVLMICIWLLGAPGLRALDPPPVNGSLLIDAKGEVDVYHNGTRLPLGEKPGDRQHLMMKISERAYKAGDAIVLHVRSPYVYRAIVVAINLTGKPAQIAIRKSDWRYLGEASDPRKITAAQIGASQTQPVAANPDPNGADERNQLGIMPASEGGSEWVKTEKQSNNWYCVGFVITPEMLKSPLPLHP